MADLASVHIIVHGIVQGVYFRDFTCRHTDELGVIGYVRNLPNGTVEAVAEGERKQLEKLIERIKVGPPGARVTRIDTKWSEYSGKYSDFTLRF